MPYLDDEDAIGAPKLVWFERRADGRRDDMQAHQILFTAIPLLPMETLSLSQLRRDPVAALMAARNGRGVRIIRRAKVIAEFDGASTSSVNSQSDPAYLKRHAPPLPRTIKCGEKGVVSQLARDREQR